MAKTTTLCFPKHIFKQTHSIPTLPCPVIPQNTRPLNGKVSIPGLFWNSKPVIGIVGSALALGFCGFRFGLRVAIVIAGHFFAPREPAIALSLPTWAIHVSSVVEWIIAMTLVWQYGEKSGFESWKGLSGGMVPLFGGGFCARTWHFFYNSESPEDNLVGNQT